MAQAKEKSERMDLQVKGGRSGRSAAEVLGLEMGFLQMFSVQYRISLSLPPTKRQLCESLEVVS